MKDLYAISEMASMFGVTRQTLIYYDRIGLFSPAYVNDEGYRFYAPTQIPELRLICLLRDLGVELKEIEQRISSSDPAPIVACLSEQVGKLDKEIEALQNCRESVVERLEFYRTAMLWKDRLGKPMLMHYPERFVLIEPFPEDEEIDRGVLHTTLMKSLLRLREEAGVAPVRGWGTMLRRKSLGTDNPLKGAAPFVTVPKGVDLSGLTGVRMLPEGIYLCESRWGMPYNTEGIDRLTRFMKEHGMRATGNAFDFCLLDTTSYDEYHQEDFCCIQIPIEV